MAERSPKFALKVAPEGADDYQVEVLGPAAEAVWMCPECGHGSSELRDERAHLDAHRQLRVFFQQWEAGTTPEPVDDRRPRRWRTLVAAIAAVLVLLFSVSVFSRINQAPDAFRATVPATVVPDTERSQPVTGVVTPAPSARPADPSPAAPVQTARPAAPVRAVPTPVSDQVVPAPVSTPAPDPAATVPAPGSSSGGYVAPTAPAHLLSACLLGICLHIL